MEQLRNRWNRLPLWGKVVSILIVLNEIRACFVAYWAIDNGALDGSMPFDEMALLVAVVLLPPLILKLRKRA